MSIENCIFSSLVLVHYKVIQIKYIKTTSSTTSIFSTVWEEVDGTAILHHWQQYQNVYFWWEMFFGDSINNTFTWRMNQFLLLNNFSFLFIQTFLFVNSFFFFWQLEPWILWQFQFYLRVYLLFSYFLSILLIMWMLVTACKIQFVQWKILIMFMLYDTWKNKR